MKAKNLFPKYLKVAAAYSTYVTPPNAVKVNKNETKYVADLPLLQILSKMLDFKFEIIVPTDNAFGYPTSSGNWTGVIGMLQRGEADMAVSKVSYSEKRASVVDFSHPYQYDPITFITNKPECLSNTYAIFHPFQPSVWFAVASTLVLLQFLFRYFKMANYSFLSMLLKSFGNLLAKPVSIKTYNLSSKLLIWSWIVGAMLLAYAYKAVILSSLTFPTMVGIRDIEQLAKASEKSSFKCASYAGTDVYEEILSLGSDSWKKISKCMNRTGMALTNVTTFFQISNNQGAYLGRKTHLKSHQKAFFVSEDKFRSDMVGVAVRKSFCCKDMLDKAIHKLAAFGILDKIFKEEEFFFILNERSLAKKDPEKNKKLTVEDFYGAFVVLGLGLTLALAVFVMEIIIGRGAESSMTKSDKKNECFKMKESVSYKKYLKDTIKGEKFED